MRRIVHAAIALFCLSQVVPMLVPIAAAYGTGKKKAEEKARRPTLEYERYRRVREVSIQMAEKRKAIRDQLEALLKYEKDEKERPALLFRLAENNFEEAMTFFNQAQELDEQVAKDAQNERLRAEVESQKKVLRVQEDKWRSKAVDLYKQIVDEFTNYPDRDQVIFYLGYSLWDMNRHKEALNTYRQLVEFYPNSQYIPDAYLTFGEYYFDQAKLEKALMAYKKVAEFRESPVYPFALYKQGWCYFNLHEWEKAKEMFQSVIYLADMEEGTTGRKIEIRKEALKDFVLTYSHSGSATAAPQVFKRVAPQEAQEMLVNLARMYFGDGQDKQAVLLYSYLITEEKCSAEVPFYQGRVVDCASRVGNKRYTVNQVRKLVELFKQVKKCLAKPTPQQQERLKEADELAELTLRKLSSTWYKEAKETKQKETFLYAQEMFGDYLELFPNSPDAYEMRFGYAELLFHRLGLYERAASEYSKVVAQDMTWLKANKKFPEKGTKDKQGRSAPGTYMCDAAYKAVIAHREIMKEERKKERKKIKLERMEKSEVPKAEAIPKNRMRFIKAAVVYMDHCPKDQDLCSIKYDIAESYYNYNHFEEAIKRYDEVVRECSEDDLAQYAANLVLNALDVVLQDFNRLDQHARQYFKNQTLMDKHPELQNLLSKLIPKIAFKRITELETLLARPKEGKRPLSKTQIHYRVAYEYIKFVKEFKTHELADEALFNSSVEFEQAERLDLARRAREKLIEDYPTSDLVPGTIFNLAENYERMTNFNEAARLYEQYAKTYKKMKGLGKAVSYEKKPSGRKSKKGKKEKRGRKEKEKTVKKKEEKEERFVGNRRTWNSEDAQAALMNAGIYREALHQYPEAISDRLEFVNLFPRTKDAAKVYYSLGLLYEKMKNYAKAAEVFARYSEDYLSSNPDRAIAAHMKRAEMLSKLQRWKDAGKEMQTTISLYQRYGKTKKRDLMEAAEAAAHSQFILSEPTYKNYLKYRFTKQKSRNPKQQQEQLKKQLEEKTRHLEKVSKLYTEIAKLKQPEWAIASLYKLGRAYENFAETFYKAPLPQGLTAEQQEVYQQALREKGQPWEDKAVAHFQAAVDKGSELGFYSRFNQLALNKLQHYRPGEYPREDLGFRLSVVSEMASRNPLLLASWEEVRKNPGLLNEPPLLTQRQGGVTPITPPKGHPPRPAPPGQPKGNKPGKPTPGEVDQAKAGVEKPPPEKMPAGTAAEAKPGEEPEDEFE